MLGVCQFVSCIALLIRLLLFAHNIQAYSFHCLQTYTTPGNPKVKAASIAWEKVPVEVQVQLERLEADDARSIGMNYAQARKELEERWFQEANKFHKDAQRCFNRSRIYQGAGRHTADDRAFLKVVQSRILEEGSMSFGLLEELKWMVPNSLFDFDGFSCLVDTPGLDDTDPFRIAQTKASIKASNTVLVFSKVRHPPNTKFAFIHVFFLL
jgi:hypothetical protein